MSGRKGSVYEREFVRLVQDAGLVARRVPLSGAMQGYDDDVVVCDEYRIECKYRKKACGFKRLHDWMGTADVLVLPDSGLVVYTLAAWLELIRAEVDGTPAPELTTITKRVTRQQGLLGWLGSAHYLAVRRPHHPWLVMEAPE